MNINKKMITDISGVNPRKCMKCGKCISRYGLHRQLLGKES